MSIDLTRLDCVHGVSIEAARDAVVAALAEGGLQPCAGAPEAASRAVYLAEDRGFIVIVDSDPFAEEPWAEKLSKALGATAVGIIAYPDFGSLVIARFASGKTVGRVAIDEGTERDADDWLTLELAFLEDLAPAKQRAALRKGISVGVLTDEMAVAIARKVGLPAPRDKYQGPPEGALRLSFEERAATPEKPKELSARDKMFNDLFASAGIGLGDVEITRTVVTAENGQPSAEELRDIEALAEEADALTPAEIARMAEEPDLDGVLPRASTPLPARAALAPPVPGGTIDGDVDGFLGRDFVVGRMQWNGGFADVGEDVLGVVKALADALLAASDGAGTVSVDLRPSDEDVPIRVGGPLVASSTKAGAAIWQKAARQLAKGGRLWLRGDASDVMLRHRPANRKSERAVMERAIGYEPSPVTLEWNTRRPSSPRAAADLAARLDEIFRRASRSRHVTEELVLAQRHPVEIDYPRLAGLWSAIRKRAWYETHVASPAWRLFVPKGAAKKLKLTAKPPPGITVAKSRGGHVVIASASPDPFTMTPSEMNALAKYLLRAFGTKKELASLESKVG